MDENETEPRAECDFTTQRSPEPVSVESQGYYVYDFKEIQEFADEGDLNEIENDMMNEKENDEPGTGHANFVELRDQDQSQNQDSGNSDVDVQEPMQAFVTSPTEAEASDRESDDGHIEHLHNTVHEDARIDKFMEDFDKRYKDDLLNYSPQDNQKSDDRKDEDGDRMLDQDGDNKIDQDPGPSESCFTGNANTAEEYDDDDDLPLAQRILKIKKKRRKEQRRLARIPKKRKYVKKIRGPPIKRSSRSNAGRNRILNDFFHGIEQVKNIRKTLPLPAPFHPEPSPSKSHTLSLLPEMDVDLEPSDVHDNEENVDLMNYSTLECHDQDHFHTESNNFGQDYEDEDDLPLSQRIFKRKKIRKRKKNHDEDEEDEVPLAVRIKRRKKIPEVQVQLSATGRPLRAKSGKNSIYNEFVHGIEQLKRKKKTLQAPGLENPYGEEDDGIEWASSNRPVRSTAGITSALNDFNGTPEPVVKRRVYPYPRPILPLPEGERRLSLPVMIMELFRRRGRASYRLIMSYLVDKYQVNLVRTGHLIRKFLLRAVEAGILFRCSGIGAIGTFRLCTKNPPYFPKGIPPKKRCKDGPKPVYKRKPKPPTIDPLTGQVIVKKVGRPRKIREPKVPKKIGRPPGAKNKPKPAPVETVPGSELDPEPIPVALDSVPVKTKKRGRPPGAKNKPMSPSVETGPGSELDPEPTPVPLDESIPVKTKKTSNPAAQVKKRPKPPPGFKTIYGTRPQAKIRLPKNIQTEVQAEPEPEEYEIVELESPPASPPPPPPANRPPSPVAGPSRIYDPYSKYQGLSEAEQLEMVLHETRIQQVTLSDSDSD